MEGFWAISLVVCMAVTIASGQYPNSVRQEYGAPPAVVNSYLPQPQHNELAYGPPPPVTTEAPRELKVFRHVFVHSAPNDGPEESQIRRIRGPGGDEKHVNIIFVKAPAPAAPDQQVVDIPNDGGRKTLVYVLLKKAGDAPDVQFSAPPPTQPSKPEVYFIRYKDQTTPKPLAADKPIYGAPAQQPPAPVLNKVNVPVSPNSIAGYAK